VKEEKSVLRWGGLAGIYEVRWAVSRALYCASKQVKRLHEPVRDNETSKLPPGYRLDLISDPDVIVLRRPDGTIVARFTRFADPQEIRRAAEEDRTALRGGRNDD
jgi:hypothetical protein